MPCAQGKVSGPEGNITVQECMAFGSQVGTHAAAAVYEVERMYRGGGCSAVEGMRVQFKQKLQRVWGPLLFHNTQHTAHEGRARPRYMRLARHPLNYAKQTLAELSQALWRSVPAPRQGRARGQEGM